MTLHASLSPEALMGLTEAHLVSWHDTQWPKAREHLLQADVLTAWQAMQVDAQQSGIALAMVSAFRSYERQRLIFNEKALGLRPVFDEFQQALDRAQFSDEQWLHRVLRFSALPGLSRHHWGTDIDVFNAEAIAQGYQVQLLGSEFEQNGPCANLYQWLKRNARRFGFYFPYAEDLGGVAPEPWHLSYFPLSEHYVRQIPIDLLRAQYQQYPLALQPLIDQHFDGLLERYALRIQPN